MSPVAMGLSGSAGWNGLLSQHLASVPNHMVRVDQVHRFRRFMSRATMGDGVRQPQVRVATQLLSVI
ncbi:MAG TPA: hypothetical protein VF148_18865 [Acidimicrobiia bacterium]